MPNYQNNNLGWCEAPTAVEHPRETGKPPGTPSGRRLRLEIAKSPVERLFPPSGGVSRGSVRVGGETFLLPSYGFSFGYKRKGVSIAPPTKAQRKIVGHKYALNKATVMRTRILSVTLVNSLGVTAPLMNKGSRDSRSVRLGEHRGAKKRAPFSTATAALKPDFTFLFV